MNDAANFTISHFLSLKKNRIVRNKAAEKAKHVHQQSQNSGTPPGIFNHDFNRK